MRLFSIAIGILAVTTVVACQQRSAGESPPGSTAPEGASPGGASPGGSESPGGGTTPIAPAIEPSHPDAERTIPLPSSFPSPAPDGDLVPSSEPAVPTDPE